MLALPGTGPGNDGMCGGIGYIMPCGGPNCWDAGWGP